MGDNSKKKIERDELGRALKVSRRQAQMIVFIYEFMDGIGRSPTIREIGTAVGISSTSVANYNLQRLVALGWIEMSGDHYDTRRIKIVGAEYTQPPLPDEIIEQAKISRTSENRLHEIAAKLGDGYVLK